MEKSTVEQIARECLDAADGDAVQATKAMHSRALEDVDLYRHIADQFIEGGCYAAIRRECRRLKRPVYLMPQPSADAQRARVIEMGRAMMQSEVDKKK